MREKRRSNIKSLSASESRQADHKPEPGCLLKKRRRVLETETGMGGIGRFRTSRVDGR
jgi:hypothetical protein